ncbi:MAG TPA: RidA family protein [Candidatus Krumholzibacteria bacterium]|nr:RidA family protein [Candidatus Krumholzibacteria bacterium]
MNRTLQPEGWKRPKGYSYGVVADGRLVFLSGQIGTDASGAFAGPGLVAQAGRALRNIVALLAEAGARPEHVVRMTWYVTDIDEYRRSQRELGEVYRAVLGAHYPPMALVAVAALVEPDARVEIEATAVVPHASGAVE